ncbi:DUF2127 domain-containing protein [Vibrio diazotrophicus]|uniref:DUF2127 domain-containing protein n=1 Tax=Vibrio diazotrophicus TaxID=685 RepID=UPI0005A85A50|nr:DUF2127 domain-containing protein [Vibrio diazotrophicus]
MTSSHKGLKAIAALEAFKGLLSLIVAFGLHVLAGQNLQRVAETIVSHAHLNPAGRIPSLFIHDMSTLPEGKIVILSAMIRFMEAYGLWRGFVWIEWFALISGGVYLPFEIYEMYTHISAIGVGIFLVNVAVVWYMARILLSKRKERRVTS